MSIDPLLNKPHFFLKDPLQVRARNMLVDLYSDSVRTLKEFGLISNSVFELKFQEPLPGNTDNPIHIEGKIKVLCIEEKTEKGIRRAVHKDISKPESTIKRLIEQDKQQISEHTGLIQGIMKLDAELTGKQLEQTALTEEHTAAEENLRSIPLGCKDYDSKIGDATLKLKSIKGKIVTKEEEILKIQDEIEKQTREKKLAKRFEITDELSTFGVLEANIICELEIPPSAICSAGYKGIIILSKFIGEKESERIFSREKAKQKIPRVTIKSSLEAIQKAIPELALNDSIPFCEISRVKEPEQIQTAQSLGISTELQKRKNIANGEARSNFVLEGSFRNAMKSVVIGKEVPVVNKEGAQIGKIAVKEIKKGESIISEEDLIKIGKGLHPLYVTINTGNKLIVPDSEDIVQSLYSISAKVQCEVTYGDKKFDVIFPMLAFGKTQEGFYCLPPISSKLDLSEERLLAEICDQTCFFEKGNVLKEIGLPNTISIRKTEVIEEQEPPAYFAKGNKYELIKKQETIGNLIIVDSYEDGNSIIVRCKLFLDKKELSKECEIVLDVDKSAQPPLHRLDFKFHTGIDVTNEQKEFIKGGFMLFHRGLDTTGNQ